MTTPTLFTAPLGNVNWRCPHKGCPGHHDWRVGDVPLSAPPVCGLQHGRGKGPAEMIPERRH